MVYVLLATVIHLALRQTWHSGDGNQLLAQLLLSVKQKPQQKMTTGLYTIALGS